MYSYTHYNRWLLLAITLLNGKVVQSFTPSGVAFSKPSKLQQPSISICAITQSSYMYPTFEPRLSFADTHKKRCLAQYLSAKESESSLEFVKAGDGDALQALFEKQCDKDGLMTKKSLVSIPLIDNLLVCSKNSNVCVKISFISVKRQKNRLIIFIFIVTIPIRRL